jgi:hypothetical protein
VHTNDIIVDKQVDLDLSDREGPKNIHRFRSLCRASTLLIGHNLNCKFACRGNIKLIINPYVLERLDTIE